MSEIKPMKVAIYALECPESGRVRYVGKANNARERFVGHMRDSKSKKTPLYCWMRSLSDRGMLPVLRVLEEVDRDRWQDAERRWIAKFREEGDLLNLAAGGNEPFMTSEQRASAAKAATAARHSTEESERLWKLKRNLGASLRWAKKNNPDAYRRVVSRLKPYVLTHPHLFAGIKAL